MWSVNTTRRSQLADQKGSAAVSVKIKVSYTTPEELQRVKKLLEKDIDKCKVSKENAGEYKRAYITLKK